MRSQKLALSQVNRFVSEVLMPDIQVPVLKLIASRLLPLELSETDVLHVTVLYLVAVESLSVRARKERTNVMSGLSQVWA